MNTQLSYLQVPNEDSLEVSHIMPLYFYFHFSNVHRYSEEIGLRQFILHMVSLNIL